MSQPDVNSWLETLKNVLKFMKEYSILDFIKSCAVTILLTLTIRLCYNPEFIFKQYLEYVRTTHTEETLIREDHDAMIKELLPTMLYKYHADRVYVVQFHNGVSDWKYGSMRFEKTLPGVRSIKTAYDHIHLSWLTLPDYLKKHDVYIGHISDFANIDHTLYEWYLNHGTEYVACILLKDPEGFPVGILGFMWNGQIPLEQVKDKMMSYLYEDRALLAPHVKHNIINAEIK